MRRRGLPLVLHFRLFSSVECVHRYTHAGTTVFASHLRGDFSSVSTDLGFIDYVVEHQVRFIGGGAETSFSLATACIDLSTDNCHRSLPQKLRFNVMFHDCDEDLNCIDSVSSPGEHGALRE